MGRKQHNCQQRAEFRAALCFFFFFLSAARRSPHNQQNTRTQNSFHVGEYRASNTICDQDKFLLTCVLVLLLIRGFVSSRVCLGPTPVPKVCFSCQAAASNVMFQTQQEASRAELSRAGV